MDVLDDEDDDDEQKCVDDHGVDIQKNYNMTAEINNNIN